MDTIFADTNALSRLLDGHEEIAFIMQDKFIYISVITWLEMQCKANITKQERLIIKSLLDDCYVVELNEQIKKKAIAVRLSARLKLMDAIIAASALSQNMTLLTGDAGFKNVAGLPLIFVPVSDPTPKQPLF